jgi:pimeloyl-ACP methyl ester carboxylesterase
MNIGVAPRRLQARAVEPLADYLPVSWGQAHRLQSHAAEAAGPPLYAFHGTAYSGRTFAPLMRSMTDRRVAALDTPGYGGSSRPLERWSLERYATALLEAVEASGESRIDLLGYHTGAMLAVQVAAMRPDLVRRLILIGVPYFPDPEERAAWRERLAAPMRLTEDFEQLRERWDYLVEGRAGGAALETGFAHFVDELRAYPYGFWAHDAAFTFDPGPSLARVTQPTLVLNPRTPLAEPSRQAAARISNARVVEMSHLGHGVLDVAASELADHINAFLDEGQASSAPRRSLG